MTWIGRGTGERRAFMFAEYADGQWGPSRTVVESDRLLVNVADFPSLTRGGDGTLWAHWLERDSEGFGYGVRVVRSGDGGRSWSAPWTPHQDGTPTEHGFVAMVPGAEGVGVLWLDGRAFADARSETALYFRSAGTSGAAGPEVELDPRVCDCCQTDVASTADGAVLVYRDRSPDEIRDIRLLRYDGDSWTDEGLVHEDGWETGACPINGPAVAADGERVAVAWFTAAEGESMTKVAFSNNGGRSFGPPVRVDDGAPAGRVDLVLLRDGSALVSWVERVGEGNAHGRLRRVDSAGRLLETIDATGGSSERVVGFPRLARADDGAIILAWTDGAEVTPRVRVTRIDVEESS